jgi:hypothetical protein
MLKSILAGLLLVTAAVPASADSDRTTKTYKTRQSADHAVRNPDRYDLGAARAAHRAAGARVGRVQAALRRSERDLRRAQVQLDTLTARYNRAAQTHRTRDARVLAYRLDHAIKRAEDLEAQRDFQRARLNIARVDYSSARDQLLTAARARANRGEG